MARNLDCKDLEEKYQSLEAEAAACKEENEAFSLYRSLIENAGEAILVARDDRIIFANPRAEELFGWTQHDLGARPIAEFIHAEDRETVMRQYEKLLGSEQAFRVPPFRIVDRSDNVKWVRLRAALFSTDINPAVFFFLTDMTRRIKAEQELRRSEEKYRRVIDTTSGGYILMDPNFLIIDVNRSLLQMLGCEREELIGKLPYTLYDKKSVTFYFANQDHISFEAQFAVKDGRDITLLYNRSTLRDEKGAVTGYVSFLSDLTELKLVQQRLRLAEERYRRMYENAVQGMFQSTLSGKLLRANPSYARVLGYNSFEELLATEHDLSALSFDPEDRQQMLVALQSEGRLANYENKLKRKDGRPVWLLFNVRLTEDDDGKPVIEGIIVDNTAKKLAEEELRKSEEKFRRLSILDNLTGLYNTRYMYKALADLIAESEASGMPFSLIFLDMDNFKHVVDTYGHLNGSRTLQEVAATIQSVLIEPAFGVAYGGDEFVVALPGFTKKQAAKKAREIQTRMRKTVYLTSQGFEVQLSASFGIATFPEDAADRTALLALADKAMFAIKKRGKNAIGITASVSVGKKPVPASDAGFATEEPSGT
ncbi:MAG: PAS domain S-box protein [Desulfobacterales bacterium]|nr:PAS domain S-box protein [Desulfobacterales bacterium]